MISNRNYKDQRHLFHPCSIRKMCVKLIANLIILCFVLQSLPDRAIAEEELRGNEPTVKELKDYYSHAPFSLLLTDS